MSDAASNIPPLLAREPQAGDPLAPANTFRDMSRAIRETCQGIAPASRTSVPSPTPCFPLTATIVEDQGDFLLVNLEPYTNYVYVLKPEVFRPSTWAGQTDAFGNTFTQIDSQTRKSVNGATTQYELVYPPWEVGDGIVVIGPVRGAAVELTGYIEIGSRAWAWDPNYLTDGGPLA